MFCGITQNDKNKNNSAHLRAANRTERDCRTGDGGKLQRRRTSISFYHTQICIHFSLARQRLGDRCKCICQNKAWAV